MKSIIIFSLLIICVTCIQLGLNIPGYSSSAVKLYSYGYLNYSAYSLQDKFKILVVDDYCIDYNLTGPDIFKCFYPIMSTDTCITNKILNTVSYNNSNKNTYLIIINCNLISSISVNIDYNNYLYINNSEDLTCWKFPQINLVSILIFILFLVLLGFIITLIITIIMYIINKIKECFCNNKNTYTEVSLEENIYKTELLNE